jgi:hypothetical protein
MRRPLASTVLDGTAARSNNAPKAAIPIGNFDMAPSRASALQNRPVSNGTPDGTKSSGAKLGRRHDLSGIEDVLRIECLF